MNTIHPSVQTSEAAERISFSGCESRNPNQTNHRRYYMESDQDVNRAERGQPSAAPPPENITNARSHLGNRSRWMAPVFLTVYGALVVAAAVPLIIFDIVKATPDESFKRIFSGVAFIAMVIVIPISLWGIINHIVCFTRPSLQKYVVRMVWIIPIFEFNCWFSLRFPTSEIYLDSLRQVYQSYVIYNFTHYIWAFFEEVPNFDSRLAMKPKMKLSRLCFCFTRQPNQRLIDRCKKGVLSYAVVQIIASVVIIITHLTETYGEGSFSTKTAYLWLTIIVTVSKILAMGYMALLRRITLDELKMLPRSGSQFAGIHLVIFVTGFQGTILHILAENDVMTPKAAWGFEDNAAFAKMMQDFLVCIEMVGFAILFSYSFDYKRYDTEDGDRMSIPQVLKQITTFAEIISNVRNRLRGSEYQQSAGLLGMEHPPAVEDPPAAAAASSPTSSPTQEDVSSSSGNEDRGMEDQNDLHQHEKNVEDTIDSDKNDCVDDKTDDSDIHAVC